MDDTRFDRWAKMWATGRSRRSLIGGLVGGVLGTVLAPTAGLAGRCKPGKRCEPDSDPCPGTGLVCEPDGRLTCGDSPEVVFCGGRCFTPGCAFYALEFPGQEPIHGAHEFNPKTCTCCRRSGVPCAGGDTAAFGCCRGCDADAGVCR